MVSAEIGGVVAFRDRIVAMSKIVSSAAVVGIDRMNTRCPALPDASVVSSGVNTRRAFSPDPTTSIENATDVSAGGNNAPR